VCDWNNDGRLDLVTGERNGYYTVFLRKEDSTLTNAGRIQAHGTDIMTNNNSWPYVCDWNLDGRKDLLAGQEGLGLPCNVYVYLNEGTDSLPVFGDSTPVLQNGIPFTDYRCVPLLVDLDRDGRRDLVLGEWYSSVRLYGNVGTDTNPVFAGYINLVQPDPDSFVNGNPPRINFTDWDGDGDLDMITCDYYGSVFLRRNITPTGIEDTMNDGRGPMNVGATIVRGVLFLPRDMTELPGNSDRVPRPALLNAAGRTVLALHCGPNDASRLAPGVYFIRGQSAVGGRQSVVQKVILTQ
jgi:hypothetical protein